jgi:hypothetical protein
MAGPAIEYGPKVQRVPLDTPIDNILYLLKRDGGVFVQGFVPPDDVDQAYSECRERLENDVEWNGSFFPSTYDSTLCYAFVSTS